MDNQSSSEDTSIHAGARIWLENGEWHIEVIAPAWVAADVMQNARTAPLAHVLCADDFPFGQQDTLYRSLTFITDRSKPLTSQPKYYREAETQQAEQTPKRDSATGAILS